MSVKAPTDDDRTKAKKYISLTNLSDWPKPDSCLLEYLHSWVYFLFHISQRWYKFFSKIFVKNKDDTTTYRWHYPLQVLPCINTFYDLFFDETTIQHESVRSLLDILGLINALLLGAALSMFMGINYNELMETDQRFGYVPEHPDFSEGYARFWHESRAFSPKKDEFYARPSAFYFINVAKSISLYFVNVIVVVYVYVDMVGKVPDEDEKEDLAEVIKQSFKELANTLVNKDKTERAAAVSADESPVVDDILSKGQYHEEEYGFEMDTKENATALMFLAWWAYARYGVILCLFSTILGLYYAVWSCHAAVYIKFPDLWMHDHPTYSAFPDNYELSPLYAWTVFFKGVGGLVVGTSIICCGFGTTYRYSVEDDRKLGLLLRKSLRILKNEWKKIQSTSRYTNAAETATASKIDDKHRYNREHVGKAYAKALEEAFDFCVATDDWIGAHAVLVSVRNSGLVNEFDSIVTFILRISKTGDVVHGIDKHFNSEEKAAEKVRSFLEKSGDVMQSSGSLHRVAPAELVRDRS